MNKFKKQRPRIDTLKQAFIFIAIVLMAVKSNAQGPNAPEAGSFEPVDATDMVNLYTGDLTYVIPLLNVPSPEGGYPLALSYHAGIGMDQESSWVGLGWSLNPGTINRGVNGYPDDWKNGNLVENFLDVGGSETTHTLSASYTSLASGGATISASIAHNSNKGFGGSVSAGYKYSGVGIGAGIGVNPGGNVSLSGNASFGALSIDQDGIGLSIPLLGEKSGLDDAGAGIGIFHSYEGQTSYSFVFSQGARNKKNSLGINFSSNSISVKGSLGGIGIGSSSFINKAISTSDYNYDVDNKSFSIPILAGDGFITLGYSKQKVKWYLNSRKNTSVSGALFLGDAIKFACQVRRRVIIPGVSNTTSTTISYLDSSADCNCSNFPASNLNGVNIFCEETILLSSTPVNGGEYYMDSYEVGILDGKTELKNNNAMFPAYDNYQVSGQGLSGSLMPIISRTGGLMGLPRRIDDDADSYEVRYNLGPNSGFNRGQVYTNVKPRVDFSFKNEYSSSFQINPGDFVNANDPNEIYGYYNGGGTNGSIRKQDGRVVEYFSLKEMLNGSVELLPKDFVENTIDSRLIDLYTNDDYGRGTGIGGYAITTPDGKTYHYKQPVINSSTRTRFIGVVDGKPEHESYFETSHGEYATHWLLTAITGPDFLKNPNSTETYPEEGDFGYWVRFDYGKWSDTDIWKGPFGKEYNISPDNPDVKSNTHGFKQLYYLDRIKTRTHTAIFVKNIREDDLGIELNHRQFSGGVPNSQDFFDSSYIYPSQVSLRLEKIILLKNENDNVNKSSGFGLANEIYVGRPQNNVSIYPVNHNLHSNVIDVTDNIDFALSKAIKVIDFGSHYNYDLVNGAPHTSSGRLTLNGLTFLGKMGQQYLPPFVFEYNNSYNFDFENKKDLWGYHKDDPSAWSLNKIVMPTGGNIGIEYEPDDFDLVAIDPSLSEGTGGGIRVKKVSINNQTNSYFTTYAYSIPGLGETPSDANYKSSGVLSYLPLDEGEEPTIGYGAELPAPIPFYEYVTVKSGQNNQTVDFLDKAVFHFKVLEAKDVDAIKFGDLFEISSTQNFFDYNNPNQKNVSANEITVLNNLSSLGQILEISQFNNENQLLSKTKNTYAPFNEITKGIVQEGFEVYKEVDYENTAFDDWLINSSKRITYPSVLKETEILSGGYNFKTEFVKYDDISGMLLETLSYDSEGRKLKTEITPAYQIKSSSFLNAYPGMGPKLNGLSSIVNQNQKNMLTQIAVQKNRIELGGVWKELSVGINTWKDFDANNIWRKHKTFTWNGELDSDGTYLNYESATNDSFNWIVGAQQTNENWLEIAEVVSYDKFSLPTMFKDINNNYISRRTCDDDTKILATSNSKLADWKATGAEYLSSFGNSFEGGIITNSTQSSDMAHTGKYSVLVNPGQEGFKNIMLAGSQDSPEFYSTPGKFRVSVWVNTQGVDNARINTGNGNEQFNGEKISAGGWTQLNHYFDFSGSSNLTLFTTCVNSNVYMDDFKIYPVWANVVSYVYNEWDELTHIIGANNLATRYEYDSAGRLTSTFAEVADFSGAGSGGFKRVSQNSYTYKN